LFWLGMGFRTHFPIVHTPTDLLKKITLTLSNILNNFFFLRYFSHLSINLNNFWLPEFGTGPKLFYKDYISFFPFGGSICNNSNLHSSGKSKYCKDFLQHFHKGIQIESRKLSSSLFAHLRLPSFLFSQNKRKK
jgi:hypothetical protein